MENNLTIKAGDGSGSFSAYAAYPKTEKAPAVIVIQEIFGVNKNLRNICDKLAGMGYVAVCPDLFWRQEPGVQLTDQTPEEWDHAFALYKGFNVDKGVDDLKATLDAVRALPRVNGKVGAVGYCLGGKLAYLMATRSTTDCNVAYYGVGIDEMLDEAKNIKKPLLMHIAGKDGFVTPDKQEKIIAGLKDKAEIHIYKDRDHAFTRVGGKNFDQQDAELANNRTYEFFAQNLK